jgi:hypothetical protein
MQLQMYRNFLRYGSVHGPEGEPYRHHMIARKICLHPYLFPDIWPKDVDPENDDFA